jgi:hypothetical protein
MNFGSRCKKILIFLFFLVFLTAYDSPIKEKNGSCEQKKIKINTQEYIVDLDKINSRKTVLKTEVLQENVKIYNESDLEIIAKTVYGEARGCSEDEWRLVIWCILQRVDSGQFGDGIHGVITKKNQFGGYNKKNPIDERIMEICIEELESWSAGEKAKTHEIYTPTIPYYYFEGDGDHNWFREDW